MRRQLLAIVMLGSATAVVAPLVAAGPAGAAPPAPRQIAYLAGATGNRLLMLDVATSTPLKVVTGFNEPSSIAVTPDGTHAYVTNSAGLTVSVLDTATSTVTATVSGLNRPLVAAATPDGTRVYVTNQSGNTVSVISTATNTVTATVPVGVDATGLALTPDGGRAYVASLDGTVSVIDTATNMVTATIAVGRHPQRVAIAQDDRHAYVTNGADSSVSVIDTATNTVTGTVTVGHDPVGVAVTPDGGHVYVACVASGVSVIDTATNAVSTILGAGEAPTGIAVSPDGTKVHVGDGGSNFGAVIDVATNTVTTHPFFGWPSTGIAYNTVVPTPPTVRMSITDSDVPLAINVDASASEEGLFQFASFTYDWGDGTAPETVGGLGDGHVYAHRGTYTVTVTAKDRFGLTGTASQQKLVVGRLDSFALMAASNNRYVLASAGGTGPLVADQVRLDDRNQQLDFMDVDGTNVALRARGNFRYVTVDAASHLVASSVDLVPAALFRPIHNADGSISLLSLATNRYVSSNNGTAPLAADRLQIAAWEKFYPAHTAWSLFARVNSRYVTAEAGGTQPLVANRTNVLAWETFDLIDAGNGYVALYSHANNRFVTAEAAGTRPLIANRTAVSTWERFRIIDGQDGNISLQAQVNGRYVTAESFGDKPLIANRTAIALWEKFLQPSPRP